MQFSSSLPSEHSVTLLHLPRNDITSIFEHTKKTDDFHVGARSCGLAISKVVILAASENEWNKQLVKSTFTVVVAVLF